MKFKYKAEIEIFVVDNASPEPLTDAEKLYPTVNFIRHAENLGYGGGNNIAIKRCSASYHLILNPDMVFESNILDELLDFMDKHEDVGVVSPKMLYDDGGLQHSCRQFPSLATFFMRGFFADENSSLMRRFKYLDRGHEKQMDVDWVLGSFMLVRRKTLDAVGSFDERYFMYYEDIDLCYRIGRLGARIVYFPALTVIHHYQRDSAKKVVSKIKIAHVISAFRFFTSHIFTRGLRTLI